SAVADELIYILENYGDHPKFFKVNGIPVIFIFATFSSGMTGERWKTVRRMVEEEYGPVYLHADIGYNKDDKSIPPTTHDLEPFDGYHHYVMNRMIVNNDFDEDTTAYNFREIYRNHVRTARQLGVNFAPCILPGYDDTNRIWVGGNYIKNRKGTVQYGNDWTYSGMWEDAIASGAKWTLILTWNEWHEGSEIDVSMEYGEWFLNLTKNYTQAFKSS
ncbi:MAG: glycoside hydrolase family 99-like domain-containing protein, partial [Candidatus Hodarchaeota archaeon]